MFNQFTLKVFNTILAIGVVVVLLLIMRREMAPVATKAVPVPLAAQIPSENPPPAEPFRTEVEKNAGPEIMQPQPPLRAVPPALVSAPSVPSEKEPSPIGSPRVSRTASLENAAAGKAPGEFIVYSRGNQLTNGFSFAEMDEKFGMNSPGDIAWEFNTRPAELSGSATLKWFLDGKPRGYPMPLTENMLQRKQVYPDMPEPGVWEIKLARPGEKDLLLFTFTILKENKGERP